VLSATFAGVVRRVRIPITSAANSSLDFGQYEQPFGWAMIGSAGRRGQGVGV
jgi:hypothetical protein